MNQKACPMTWSDFQLLPDVTMNNILPKILVVDVEIKTLEVAKILLKTKVISM